MLIEGRSNSLQPAELKQTVTENLEHSGSLACLLRLFSFLWWFMSCTSCFTLLTVSLFQVPVPCPRFVCVHLFPDCVSTPVLHHIIRLYLFPSVSLLPPVCCIHWSPSSVLSSQSCRVWSLLVWRFCKPLPEFLDWLTMYQTVLTMNRSLSRIPALYQQLNTVVLGSTPRWPPTAGEHTTAYIC